MTDFFTVMEWDIDGNAHMNNAAYVRNFDVFAKRALATSGFDFGFKSMVFLEKGVYDYLLPTWFGEVIRVETSFWNKEGFLINQEMKGADGRVVAKANLNYGVVGAIGDRPQNHPECAEAFENWRRDFVENNGLGAKALLERGIGLYVCRASYEYFHPFFIEPQGISGFWIVRKARVFSEQRIILDGVSLAKTSAEYVFVNLSSGRAIKPPSDLIERLKV